MSNPRDRQFSARIRLFKAIVRALGDLAGIALAITLVVLAWDDTGAATGDVPMRIFLVGFAVAAIIIWIQLPFPFTFLVSRREQPVPRLTLPPAMHHVAMGAVIGLAVGTTDWTTLRFAGWWQLWWTVPLLIAYSSLAITRQRSSRGEP